MLKKIDTCVGRSCRVVARHAKDHFVPHKGNNHLPRVLHHHTLIGTSLALVILKGLLIVAPIFLPSSTVFSSALTPANITLLTNQTRRDLRLGTLTVNEHLEQAAKMKAENMLQEQYFAHTSPAGKTPWSWIRASGYQYNAAAENLAVHFTTAEDVQNSWLLSASHRANIVNPRFTEIGVAVIQGMFEGYPSLIVVQMFGEPVPQETSMTDLPEDIATSTTAPALGIDPDQIRVTPARGTYTVYVSAPDATSANVSVGPKTLSLQNATGSHMWSGIVPHMDQQQKSESTPRALDIVIAGKYGTLIRQTIAWILPAAEAADIYHFTTTTPPTTGMQPFFSFQFVHDQVHRIYIAVMSVLGACLIGILVKKESRRWSTVYRTVGVILLALFLTLS